MRIINTLPHTCFFSICCRCIKDIYNQKCASAATSRCSSATSIFSLQSLALVSLLPGGKTPLFISAFFVTSLPFSPMSLSVLAPMLLSAVVNTPTAEEHCGSLERSLEQQSLLQVTGIPDDAVTASGDMLGGEGRSG